jgi:hypothetical protein
VSSNLLSRVVWGRFALTCRPADLQEQSLVFDRAARSGWPEAAAPAATWASTLIQACASGRIGSQVMWDILLAHADATTPPDVEVLLEHLPEAHGRASLGELLDAALAIPAQPASTSPSSQQSLEHPLSCRGQLSGGVTVASAEQDDWFVMVESLGAA